MVRVTTRAGALRLGAVLLTTIAVVDLASGLGLIGRHAGTSPRPTSSRAARPRAAPGRVTRPAAGTRAVGIVAAGARVRPGDRVDLLLTLDPDRYPGAEPTRTVGDGLAVLAVDRDASDPSARAVTLAVPRRLVARVAFATTAGTLTLAVVPDRHRP
ncbi:MAG: RcpC/CpaB family pilus assembly protein [Actinomycetes bacterium]